MSGPNSPTNNNNELAMTKKRRMNWDEVPNSGGVGANNNPNQGLVNKDHLQMDRRKMGEPRYYHIYLFTECLVAVVFFANPSLYDKKQQ